MDCLFCKIIQGEIPCCKVYENEHTISFLDIFPAGLGHTLVVPKKHYASYQEAPIDVINYVMETGKKVADALVSSLSAEGFNLFLNNGKVAGQVIPHLHFHLLPRFKNDGLQLALPPQKVTAEELQEICKKIVGKMR